MSVNRTAAKRDRNEAEIVAALKSVGATVQQLSAAGCPDLLVAAPNGLHYLLEVKMKGNGLTADQIEWHRDWCGDIHIVYTVRDALEAIGLDVEL